MKNTLLAVLVISLCYYDIQAQVINPHSPGYIKYQEVIPHHAIDKGNEKATTLTDGAATTDKLTNDIIAFNKMADGSTSTDKLAEILMGSLEVFDGGSAAAKPALHIMAVDECTYAGYMQYVLIKAQPLPKPRPINSKKSGWLL